MYIYLILDKYNNINGLYEELQHIYLRILKLWINSNSIDDEEYYNKCRSEEKVSKDWCVYKIPVGEYEDVYVDIKSIKSEYLIQLPETYADLRCIIRNLKIEELTK